MQNAFSLVELDMVGIYILAILHTLQIKSEVYRYYNPEKIRNN